MCFQRCHYLLEWLNQILGKTRSVEVYWRLQRLSRFDRHGGHHSDHHLLSPRVALYRLDGLGRQKSRCSEQTWVSDRDQASTSELWAQMETPTDGLLPRLPLRHLHHAELHTADYTPSDDFCHVRMASPHWDKEQVAASYPTNYLSPVNRTSFHLLLHWVACSARWVDPIEWSCVPSSRSRGDERQNAVQFLCEGAFCDDRICSLHYRARCNQFQSWRGAGKAHRIVSFWTFV